MNFRATAGTCWNVFKIKRFLHCFKTTQTSGITPSLPKNTHYLRN